MSCYLAILACNNTALCFCNSSRGSSIHILRISSIQCKITSVNAADRNRLIPIQYHAPASIDKRPCAAWIEHAWLATSSNSTNQRAHSFIFINSPHSCFISVPCPVIVLFFSAYLSAKSPILSLLFVLSVLSIQALFTLLFPIMPSSGLGLLWSTFETASEWINAVLPLCADM